MSGCSFLFSIFPCYPSSTHQQNDQCSSQKDRKKNGRCRITLKAKQRSIFSTVHQQFLPTATCQICQHDRNDTTRKAKKRFPIDQTTNSNNQKHQRQHAQSHCFHIITLLTVFFMIAYASVNFNAWRILSIKQIDSNSGLLVILNILHYNDSEVMILWKQKI